MIHYTVEYIKPNNRTRTGYSPEVLHAGTDRHVAIQLARGLAEEFPQHAAHVTIVTRENLADILEGNQK